MRSRLMVVPLVLLLAALVLQGCLVHRPPAEGTSDGGVGLPPSGLEAVPPSGAQGPGSPGEGSGPPDTPGGASPSPDWGALVAGLPDPAAAGYVAYNEAIADALRRIYASDSCVAVDSGNLANLLTPYDPGYGTYTGYYHSWGRFSDPAKRDYLWYPEYAPTFVGVEFTMEPADRELTGYSPAYEVQAAQGVHWDPDATKAAAEARNQLFVAISRIWQPAAGAYLPLGVDFWAGFSALQRLTLTGEFPAGRFLLPGEHGGDISLSMGVENFGEGGCSVGLGLRALNPAGRREPEPGDWDSLVTELPEPSFVVAEWSKYEQGMLSALRRAWAHNPQVSVNWTLQRSLEGWWEPEFTWLHLPTSSDESGYLLETLTMRLTPASEGGASGVGEHPLASSATVTEVIVWEPEYRSGSPVFEALVPARHVFLGDYLALGDDFWSAFMQLELTPGTEAELPRAGGATVFLTVEDLSRESGLVSRRYTLAWGP